MSLEGDIDNILALSLPFHCIQSQQGCCSKHTFSEVVASLIKSVNVS